MNPGWPARTLLTLLLWGGLAHAQYTGFDAQTNQFLNTSVMFGNQWAQLYALQADQVEQRVAALQQDAARQRTRLEPAGRARIAAGRASTRFTPSPAHSSVETLARGLARQTGTDPAAARSVVTQALAEYGQGLKSQGYSPTDWADALTGLLGLAWMALADVPDLPDRQVEAIRGQLRRALLADSAYQGMSDAERQALYEGGVINMLAAVARYGQESQRGTVDSALEAIRQVRVVFTGLSGVDPHHLTLTDRGFAAVGAK